jgi:hypothetical protein
MTYVPDVVYYESIKRELKRRPIHECRCSERLKTKVEGYTPHIHWVPRGTGTPKHRDEVNKTRYKMLFIMKRQSES